jgi:plastocyanin
MTARTCFAVTLGLLACAGPASPAAAHRPATHTVMMDGTRFEPEVLTVNAGDLIVWVNKDPFPHTATSKAGGFDSESIAPDESWRYRPEKKGEFAYVCSFHPTMKGTLRVK